jgi:hypothetical protein
MSIGTLAARFAFSLLVVGVPAFGGTIALTQTGGVSVSDPRTFMVGWQFSVSSALQVDGLSYWDANGDGLVESHQVAIFNSAGVSLVSAIIPSGTGSTLVSGFRTVAVSFLLTPGTYVIGGQSPSGSDATLIEATSVTTVPGVTYLQERELNTSAFVVPTANAPGTERGIFGPNFTVTATPEPGSLSLMFAAGIGVLAAFRRRRSHGQLVP